MSTVKTNNVQVGLSGTATNNFTWYQPASPDGTTRLGVGNAGATTSDVLTVNSSGNVGLGVAPAAWAASYRALQVNTTGAINGNSVAIVMSNNYRYDGTDFRYLTTAPASDYYQFNGTHTWRYAASGTAGNVASMNTGMVMDGSGNVGIGTSSPQAILHAYKSSGDLNAQIETASAGQAGLNLYNSARKFRLIADGSASALVVYDQTAGAERARIDSNGNLLVGKTTTDFGTAGFNYDAAVQQLNLTTNGNSSLRINRLSSDGNLVSFQRGGSEKGTISVSGETVSYNAFAGSHWSQLADGSKPEILRGTVMESIDELCEWPDEPTTERLCRVKVSDAAGSKKVYGVFMCWDEDWTATNDMLVTSVGAFICRVNGAVTVQEGDLLESNGDGTARVQSDDIMRSTTIGKVTCTTKTHEYADGSYCVPTVLYCG